MHGQNRIEHLVDFLEGLLLVKLPEGLIGNGIILTGSSGWQLVSSNPATGNQAMLIAATPDDQIRLKKGRHGRKATGQGNAKQMCFCLTPSIYRRSPIVPAKMDGMPIVTRWQPGASTGSPPIVQNSKDGMRIVTAGQLMLD